MHLSILFLDKQRNINPSLQKLFYLRHWKCTKTRYCTIWFCKRIREKLPSISILHSLNSESYLWAETRSNHGQSCMSGSPLCPSTKNWHLRTIGADQGVVGLCWADGTGHTNCAWSLGDGSWKCWDILFPCVLIVIWANYYYTTNCCLTRTYKNAWNIFTKWQKTFFFTGKTPSTRNKTDTHRGPCVSDLCGQPEPGKNNNANLSLKMIVKNDP